MKKILVITGPTAVCKTKLSIELAKKYNGEIINADAVQVYKGLDIGSAKVTEEEKEGIYKGHTQNYLLAYYKPEKVDMNLENKITKANCISAESDHIIVEI